jgi:hypothetical protein
MTAVRSGFGIGSQLQKKGVEKEGALVGWRTSHYHGGALKTE